MYPHSTRCVLSTSKVSWGNVTLTKVEDRGTLPNHRIFTGYTVKGWLFKMPKVGEPLIVLRTECNGTIRLGRMDTTPITELTEGGFATANSVYRLDLHPEVPYDETTLIAAALTHEDHPKN